MSDTAKSMAATARAQVDPWVDGLTIGQVLSAVASRCPERAYLSASDVSRQMSSLVDMSMFDQGVVMASLASLLSWWGFALYIYLRRDYFRKANPLSRTLPEFA